MNVEPRQHREDRRVRRTKKLLTQALTQLMADKQIKEITVKELTDLADINRGTFYLYYRDIYDMLARIEDDMFSALEKIISDRVRQEGAAGVKPILTEVFAFIAENREMCSVLLSANGDMSFLHRLNGFIREECRCLGPACETDDAEFEYSYSFAVFGCAGLIRAYLSRDCRESAARMAEIACSMLRSGSMEHLKDWGDRG